MNMKKYTTIYFDLDNTLLDFNLTEKEAITKLLKLHNLPVSDEIVKTYSAINQVWWQRFERGEILKEEIFSGRFRTFLETYGFEGDAESMSKDYFELLASGHHILSGAENALQYVKNRGYTVCITTNGVSRTQYRRIKESGLGKYFDYIFVSEDAGHQKPEKEYFDYVMNNTPEKDKSKIIVIGDSQSSDILGGINFGADTCWLNLEDKRAEYASKYEIHNIYEIKDIL